MRSYIGRVFITSKFNFCVHINRYYVMFSGGGSNQGKWHSIYNCQTLCINRGTCRSWSHLCSRRRYNSTHMNTEEKKCFRIYNGTRYLNNLQFVLQGKISREEVAKICIAALGSPYACDKTFEVLTLFTMKTFNLVLRNYLFFKYYVFLRCLLFRLRAWFRSANRIPWIRKILLQKRTTMCTSKHWKMA